MCPGDSPDVRHQNLAQITIIQILRSLKRLRLMIILNCRCKNARKCNKWLYCMDLCGTGMPHFKFSSRSSTEKTSQLLPQEKCWSDLRFFQKRSSKKWIGVWPWKKSCWSHYCFLWSLWPHRTGNGWIYGYFCHPPPWKLPAVNLAISSALSWYWWQVQYD